MVLETKSNPATAMAASALAMLGSAGGRVADIGSHASVDDSNSHSTERVTGSSSLDLGLLESR
jgi:hypothetical protein